MIPIKDVLPPRTRPLVSLVALGCSAAVLAVGCWIAPPAWPDALLGLLGLMYFFVFADNVEDRLGHERFAALVLLGSLAGLAAGWWGAWDITPAILASDGAVAAVLGAYLVQFPRSKVLIWAPWPPFLHEGPALLVLTLFGVLHAVGGLGALVTLGAGLFCGAALARVLRRPERAEVEWWGR
ncbi:MAG: rhomboid family intramembrane serine protease [Acidobacteriota bacterium]